MARVDHRGLRGPVAVVLSGLLFFLSLGDARAGYTHYWEWRRPPDRSAVARCVADMAKVAEAKREILADGTGKTGSDARFETTCDLFDARGVACLTLNGIGEDGHEVFVFPSAGHDRASSFVKTAYKPYDAVVSASLIVARDYFDDATLRIKSDGDWGAEWAPGAALYTRVFGRLARDPLSPAERLTNEAAPSEDAPESVAPSVGDRYGGYVFALILAAALVYIARQVVPRSAPRGKPRR